MPAGSIRSQNFTEKGVLKYFPKKRRHSHLSQENTSAKAFLIINFQVAGLQSYLK